MNLKLAVHAVYQVERENGILVGRFDVCLSLVFFHVRVRGAALGVMGFPAALAVEARVEAAQDGRSVCIGIVRDFDDVVQAVAMMVEQGGDGFRELLQPLHEELRLASIHVFFEERDALVALRVVDGMLLDVRDAVGEELFRARCAASSRVGSTLFAPATK